MKILYGVQGTGNGHISRSRLIATELSKRNVTVDYLFSGRPADKFFDMEAFGEYKARPGFTFMTSQGAINYVKTALGFQPLTFMHDMQNLNLNDYDFVISDFEPITAWASKHKKRDALGISHQASFLHNIPKVKGDFFSSVTLKYFAPTARHIGLHWYHFGHPILPPVIEKLANDPHENGVLVYLPFESLQAIEDVLLPIKQVQFICYHPEITSEYLNGNIIFKSLNRHGFTQDLGRSSGVICNAGFELASEALSLSKRILVKPLEKQYEQQTNAMTLHLLGLGSTMNTLDTRMIQQWLDKPSIGQVFYPDVASELAAWIADEQRESVESLSERLWKQVIYPETVLEHLDELGMGSELTQSPLIGMNRNGMNRRQRQASREL